MRSEKPISTCYMQVRKTSSVVWIEIPPKSFRCAGTQFKGIPKLTAAFVISVYVPKNQLQLLEDLGKIED